MFALLFEQTSEAYRGIIFECEQVTQQEWDRSGRDWEDRNCWVASVCDIFETKDLADLRSATHVILENLGNEVTHAYVGPGQYIQPDHLSVVEAAEALMLNRDHVFTEEGFCHQDFAVTG